MTTGTQEIKTSIIIEMTNGKTYRVESSSDMVELIENMIDFEAEGAVTVGFKHVDERFSIFNTERIDVITFIPNKVS